MARKGTEEYNRWDLKMNNTIWKSRTWDNSGESELVQIFEAKISRRQEMRIYKIE